MRDGCGVSPPNHFLLGLVLLSIAIAILQTEPTLERFAAWFRFANVVVIIVLTLE